MKRFFILFAALAFWALIPLQASQDDLRIVETWKTGEDGYHVLVMEVRGKANFRIERGSPEKDYTANHADTFGEDYLLFGYVIVHEEGKRRHDGFILIADRQGDILFEKVIDLGHDEEIVHVKKLEGILVLHIQQWQDGGNLHGGDHFLFYEEDRLQKTLEIPTEFKRVEKHREILYLSENIRGAFEYALNREGDILTPEEALRLEKGGEYETGTTFHFLREARYEGEKVIGPLHFDFPGHYTVTINGETHDFTIHPQIEGVEAHETLDGPFSIRVDAGQPFLNDTAYASGETIETPGYHLFEVKGLNGYRKKVPFTLTSGLTGVESHAVHEEPLILSFMGDGRLNGEEIESGFRLAENGNHILEIAGENGYLESHHFELHIESEQPGNGFMRLEMFLAGVTVIAVSFLFYRLYKKR